MRARKKAAAVDYAGAHNRRANTRPKGRGHGRSTQTARDVSPPETDEAVPLQLWAYADSSHIATIEAARGAGRVKKPEGSRLLSPILEETSMDEACAAHPHGEHVREH